MAHHRHKRDTNARLTIPRPRAALVAGPLAVLATAGAVSFGVLTADLGGMAPAFVAGPAVGDVTGSAAPDAADASDRGTTLSRGGLARGTGLKAGDKAADKADAKPTEVERVLEPTAVRKAIDKADTKLWTTEPLNLWTEPGEQAKNTGEIDAGERVVVTGRSLMGREEIVWEKDETRWVTAGYLSEEEPFSLGGDCTNGTSVESGVSPNIVKVHEAVCAEFPDITTYGTFRGDGEHSQGLAVDIMVSGDEGYAVAEFVRKYYAELGVSYVIYSQRIWSVERAGEGWRGMEDRGSTTANHYDHVHVTTY